MRLIFAELRKVWGNRVFGLCLAVLAAANLFLLYVGTRPVAGAAQPPAYRAVMLDLKNLDTAQQRLFIGEKLNTIKSVLQIGQLLYAQAINAGTPVQFDPRAEYPDLFEQYEDAYQNKTYTMYTENLKQEHVFLSQIKAELDTVAEYPSFLQDVQGKADLLSQISIFNTSEAGYDQANIKKTADVYAGLKNIKIEYAPQKGLFTALDYEFTDLILLAFMLILASMLVRHERDDGMLNIVRSTAGGRLKTALAKLVALAISLLAAVALMYGVNLVYCQLTFGLGSLLRSIQSVPALMRCTMQISVLRYLGRFLLAKWGAAFVMGLWVMLAALFCRRAAAGWCAALAMPLGQWLIRQAIPATSQLNVIKYANLASLMRTNELLGGYRNLYWFDTPIGLPVVELAAALVYGVLLAVAFCGVFSMAQLRQAPHFAGLRFARKTVSTHATTVMAQESRKLLILNGAALILACFCGFQVWQTANTQSYINANEIYYRYYMKNISGPYTQQSYDWLMEQNEEFRPIYELKQARNSGKISNEMYQQQMGPYYGLEEKLAVFETILQSNLGHLKENPDAHLVYETGWKRLFGFFGDGDLQDTLWAGLLCSICFAGLFAMEQKGGMRRVIMATPRGRGFTVGRKLIAGCGVAAGISVLVSAPQLILVLRDYGLYAPFSPAMSIREYAGLPHSLSLSDVMVAAGLARLLACMCMGAVVLFLSQKLGNALSAMFVAGIAFCLLPLLALSGFSALRWLSFYPLFHLPELFQRADRWAGLACCALAAAVVWLCSQYLYSRWTE